MVRAVAVAGLLLVAACGRESTGPDLSIEGVYELQSMIGKPLPYTLFAVDVVGYSEYSRIESRVLTLNPGGTWSDKETRLQTINGTTTTDVLAGAGSWQHDVASVSFASENGGLSGQGTWTPETLTITGPSGAVFVFKKQEK